MPKYGRQRRPEAGFTLIELMVVVGIIAFLSAILSLGIRRVSDSFALRGAASLVVTEVRGARTAAVAEGVVHAVELIPGNPGSIAVRRPGLKAANGVVSISSSGGSGSDPRSVILTGRSGTKLISRTLPIPSTTTSFEWVIEAAVTTADSARTVKIAGASDAFILPGATTAELPWAIVHSVTAPDWPGTIRMLPRNGVLTTFDACPFAAGSACAMFSSFGEPVRPSGAPGPCAATPCKVTLETVDGRMLEVIVESATGRVSVQRP